MGHRIETWARQTKHADGITWFLSKLEAEARADPDSELLWSVPTARSDRAYNWGESAIAPDAVGQMTTEGLQIPFYLEYELRARHPRGVVARLGPYESYYWSNEPREDQPPFPVTLFVVDTEEVEATYVCTATLNLMKFWRVLMMATASADHLLPLSEVRACTGLSRSTIYRKMRDESFPEPLKIRVRAVRWWESEIVPWFAARPRAAGDAPSWTVALSRAMLRLRYRFVA